MATINLVYDVIQTPSGSVPVIKWVGAKSSDTLIPVAIGGKSAITGGIQGSSTGWSSTSLALHGSIDGVTYVALKDTGGTAIAITTNGLSMFSTPAVWLKPVLTGGSGAIDITVVVRG